MKKTGVKIIIGILLSSIIIGLLFYLFLFVNPLKIYESNTLKWIPILITIISFYVSGSINKDTPVKFLPLLFIPFILFKPFNFAYFPFILILLLTGILILFVSRNLKQTKFKILGWIGIVGIFLFFLFNQPLILEKENFGYADNGDLINANIIWNFNKKTNFELPNHILFTKNNSEFNIASIKGKTYLITFWATWCAPCMQEKPELENFKEKLNNSQNIQFIDVSFDTDKNKWLQYIEKKKPKGVQLISDNQHKTSREFHFAGIPMHIIVNEDGTYKKYHSFEIVRKVIKKNM